MGSIVARYEDRIYDIYMASHPNADSEKVRKIIRNITEKNLKDIPCKLHNNITHELIDTTITNVFNWVDIEQPIISGAGSFFSQHADCPCPSIKMLEGLMADRAKIKDQMWQYDKNSTEYMNLNVQQLSIKVIMNADYGGSGTSDSPFYSQYIPPATTGTAKNMTTTLICCLEYSSDNDHKYAKLDNVNELFDMIYAVLNDTEDRELIYDPSYTWEIVSQRLLSRLNKKTPTDIRIINDYLKTLDQSQLTKLMLAFNVKLVLKKYCCDDIRVIMNYLNSNKINFEEEVTKESLYKAGFGKKPPEELVPYIDRVKKVVLDNCVYKFILNDAEFRASNMMRQVVCVTDTDSLMVHFAAYLDEFQAYHQGDDFVDSCLKASAFGIRLFVEGLIPKFVSYVAEGMGIKDKYYRDKFIFKNEFVFLSMMLIAKKMYAASMFVQEGNPRNIHDIAVTGLSFKKRDSAEFLEPIMMDIYNKYILTSKQINVEAILNVYYSLRKMLTEKCKTDTGYYRALSVKSVDSYDPNKKLPDQIRGSIVWNNLYPDDQIIPQDRVIIVPLSMDKLEEHSSDSRINDIIRITMNDEKNKKHDAVICLPEHFKKIPEFLQDCVDIDKLVDRLLSPFKQLLGTFDIVMPDTAGGCIASRLVYL